MRHDRRLSRCACRAFLALTAGFAAATGETNAEDIFQQTSLLSGIYAISPLSSGKISQTLISAPSGGTNQIPCPSSKMIVSAAGVSCGRSILDNYFGDIPLQRERILNSSSNMTSGANPEGSGVRPSSLKPPRIKSGQRALECGPSPLMPADVQRLVAETARRYEVNEDLAVAIAWAESDFDTKRNSPKGARGPMQLMPETAARFGVEDICDPTQNVEGGVRYLRVLQEEFKNPLLIAAAYNSGEQRIYQYAGIPPFPETVRYVAKVINYQLGLRMPTPKSRVGISGARTFAGTDRGKDIRIVPIEKNGRFIGGVMHF
jgi:hypothetical protein